MYASVEERTQDETRLYEQLMSSENFCGNLTWLSDKAKAGESFDSIVQMWRVYYSAMMKIGRLLFDSDVSWDCHSAQIEPVLNLLLNEGYSDIILQLILGASNLFVETGANGDVILRLKEIARNYYAVVRKYQDGGVMTTEDRLVKWDFIDASNQYFGAAFDIVEAAANAGPKRVDPEKEKKLEAESKRLEEKFDELFGDIINQDRQKKEKSFWRNLFSKKR